MTTYMVVNPTEATINVDIFRESDNKKERISIQPHGRPQLPEGFAVSEQFIKLNPQIKVYEL